MELLAHRVCTILNLIDIAKLSSKVTINLHTHQTYTEVPFPNTRPKIRITNFRSFANPMGK